MIAAVVAFIVIAIVVLVFVNISMSRRMENRAKSQTETGKRQPEPVTQDQTQATPTAGDLVNPVSGSIPETMESTFFPQRHHKDVDYRQALRNFAKPDSNTEEEPLSPTEQETAPISADEDYRQGLRSFSKRE